MYKIYNVLFYLLISFSVYAGKKSLSFGVYELFCDQRCNPVGISDTKPKFSWKISSLDRGFMQSAYQILVSDSEELLKLDKGNMWNSGKCKTEQSILISYQGRKLESSKKYYWKVRVWNGRKVSNWSKTGSFVTGILSEHDWGSAQWIALERDDKEKGLYPGIHSPLVQTTIGNRFVGGYKLPLARKKLYINKEIDNAIVNIAGLGHFEMFVNGKKVGNHFLDAGWTNYAKTALYVTFEIGSLLQKENVISVMLGNGFYNVPRERYFKQLISFGAPKMKLHLRINYKDGTSENIVSDELWRFTDGPITYSSIYGGEDYDAQREAEGWMNLDFDDSEWQLPVITDLDLNLISQKSEPITVRDTMAVVRKYRNSKGNWVYDLGQNFSGIVNIRLRGNKGGIVKMIPGELLNNDSTVNQQASGGPYYWKYTLSGNGLEEWHPRFTYYGFRYVEVTGVDELDFFDLTGMHTTNSASEAGHFNCSLPLFNRTYELIDWAMRSNLSSILTDCPHREKLGWLEVAHLMQYSLQYRYDLPGFYRQMMQNMADSQTEKGTIPSIAPEYVRFADGFEDSPEWGSAFIIIPWYVYKCYGDDSLLKDFYPKMKQYIYYLSSRANNHIIEYGLGDWYDLGPAHPGVSQLTSKGITATGIYYYDLSIMSKVAEMLKLEDDIRYYRNVMKEVKKAYNARFYNKDKGYYDRNSQTANAISLFYGLVDEENYYKVYENLKKDIINRNYALTSGDIGYRYLIKVLENNGDSDLIYKMNARYDVPGYGWQLAYGATALTESWQAYGYVSNNHCMLGHLMEWFFSGLGGIGQDEMSVGYKKIKISPQIIPGIRYVESDYSSPYGDIKSEWSVKDNYIKADIEIPANTQGVIYLPYRNNIYEGGIPLNLAEGCRLLEINNKEIVLEVGSGKYSFTLWN